MSDHIFGPAVEVWKGELDAIDQEASLLLRAARHSSVEQRRALQGRCEALIERRNAAIHSLALQREYAALIERRNSAIRSLLHSAFPHCHSVAGENPAELTGQSTRSADSRAAAGIDKNLAPQARKPGVLSDVKLEEVVGAARDAVTRASRTVMRTLGIKSGREGETPGAARVKQAIANNSCSSDGPSIQPPQVSVSTTDEVDRSLDAPVEAWSEPSLKSDLKDELTRVLSGSR